MLYLGADHNGYFLKEKIKKFLSHKGISWKDCGADEYNKDDDYVDFALRVYKAIKRGDVGLLACGSGHGMVIAANKLSGIRAIMPLDSQSARFGRRDDHANVLVLAAWQIGEARAKSIIAAFLSQTPGKAARYLRRLRKVRSLEK